MTRPRLEQRAFAALMLLAGTLSVPAAWPAAAKPPAEQPPLETLFFFDETAPTERLLDGTVEAVNQADLLQRQMHDPIPPVRAMRSDVPTAVDGVLAKATATTEVAVAKSEAATPR